MKEIWDILKNFAVAFGSGVLAYFEPVFNPMVLLSILAGVDIFWGLVSAVRIKKESFKFKKFVRAGIYYLIYLSIIAFIYIIGYF